MKQPSFLKLPFTTGLKTACSVLALTACLATGGVQAADQGPRHHARGQYDTVTATYVVVEGDELIAIGERFEVPVDVLKAQNINLTGDYTWRQDRQVEQGKFRPLRTLSKA